MATAIARHAGARSVVVVDNHPARLDLAKTLGATRVVDTREATLDTVQHDLAIRDGFDLGIETSGSATALGDLLTHLSLGAQLALLGLPGDDTPPNWGPIVAKQLTVHGIDGRDNQIDWERLTLAIHSGLDLTPLVTHCLPVGSFREAFERTAAGEPGKMILDWEG
jgi:threonine 3-dehydrogenase